MEVGIKQLTFQDIEYFIELIRVFEDVFEMQDFQLPAHEHLRSTLTKEGFWVFVAITENKVIGGLTAYVLEQYYSCKPLAYIYDLAVKREHQRKGIGRKLIYAFNAFCKENSFEEVFVQADKVDDYALDFYRKTKPTNEEEVVHFYYTM